MSCRPLPLLSRSRSSPVVAHPATVSVLADPELSIVVVAYRNPELTRECLRSVFEQTHGSFEVIVLDNASGDGTAEMVAAEFPRARLYSLDQNIGFARGNNLAASHARGDWLLLLNPDTVVLDGALDHLLAFARTRPDGGIYGGRTLQPDGRVNPTSCWGLPTLWSTLCFATGASTLFPDSRWLNPESLGRWERDSVRTVGAISGCLLLLRRSLWERLGGFDERFFMYGEDIDLAVRARALGFAPLITPDATVVHVVGASASGSGSKMTQILRARATLMREHWSPPKRAFGLALLNTGVALRAAGAAALARRGRRGSAQQWREAWRRRDEWRRGYGVQDF